MGLNINSYLTAQQPAPGSPDWMRLIAQSDMVPPDQAQRDEMVPVAPASLADVPGAEEARQRITPPKVDVLPSDIPMVQNFQPGQGLNSYLQPATKSMDRSLIEQYKRQSQGALDAQNSGIGQLEQYMRDFQNKPTKMDWSAAAALADSMNAQFGHKTNLYDSAISSRGMTEDEKNDKLLKLQEQIQAAKGNMSKENLQATQQMLQMIHQNDQTNLTAQHYANMERALDAKTGQSGNRLQSTQELAAQRQFLNDPINKTYIPRLDGAVKLMDLIDGAERGDYKSNKALLGQLNAEISRLETGSQSPGLNASEKTEMQSAAASTKDLYDTITNGVTGVDLSKKFDQARGMVGNLAQSYRQQIESRNKVISAGATPHQQPVFAAKSKALSDEFEGRVKKLSPSSANALGVRVDAAPVSGAPKIGDVMDGHKFLGGDPSKPESWGKL